MRAGMGLLARWFRMQPSEIDGLEVDEFRWWCEEAVRQSRAANGA